MRRDLPLLECSRSLAPRRLASALASLDVGAQHRVDARLIARPLGAEPLEHIAIEPDRDSLLSFSGRHDPASVAQPLLFADNWNSIGVRRSSTLYLLISERTHVLPVSLVVELSEIVSADADCPDLLFAAFPLACVSSSTLLAHCA